jgi:hypothetical protein
MGNGGPIWQQVLTLLRTLTALKAVSAKHESEFMILCLGLVTLYATEIFSTGRRTINYQLLFQIVEDFVTDCKSCGHPHIRPSQDVLIKPGGQLRCAMAGHRGSLKSMDLKENGKTAVTCM